MNPGEKKISVNIKNNKVRKGYAKRKPAEQDIVYLASFPKLNPNPVLEVDSSGRITFYNDAAVKILERLRVKGDLSRFLPRDMNEILKALENKKKVKFNREVEINGRTFEEHINIVSQFNTVRIYAFDITERKRVEEALRESERKLKDAQAIGRIGSWEFDVESQEIKWSDQTYKLYERDPGLGPPTVEEEATYYSQEQALELREYARRAIEEEKDFKYDLEAGLPSGRHVFFSATMQPIKDAEGRIVKLFGTVQDITERKRLEHETLETKKDAELYLDIMSHDINNLNQVSLGYLEMLINNTKLDDEQRRYAAKVLNSMRRSIRLIEDVGLLQQVKEPSEFRDIDLDEVISAVIEEFSINPYKKVDFKYSPEAGLIVRADPLIKEIFVNLVGNSIKYSGESVVIGIEVEETDKEGEKYKRFYRVSVEDNGHGVPDDRKQAIFQRSVKLALRGKGRGIGLYIVKMLAQKYGGDAWVEDRVKGDFTKGAKFCVTIPVR